MLGPEVMHMHVPDDRAVYNTLDILVVILLAVLLVLPSLMIPVTVMVY